MSRPDDFARRLTRYMADKMDCHSPLEDQADNWFMGHLATFALAERRRLRRAIAPHLSNLRFVHDLHGIVYVKEAADAIDRATKAKSAQADAIKAAPHVCKCSNGPCPKCGGTGPEGEWFEGSEVECADCGAPLIVATAEPCHGSSTFEAIDEEPDEEDDESGEDAPGAVGK